MNRHSIFGCSDVVMALSPRLGLMNVMLIKRKAKTSSQLVKAAHNPILKVKC